MADSARGKFQHRKNSPLGRGGGNPKVTIPGKRAVQQGSAGAQWFPDLTIQRNHLGKPVKTLRHKAKSPKCSDQRPHLRVDPNAGLSGSPPTRSQFADSFRATALFWADNNLSPPAGLGLHRYEFIQTQKRLMH